MTTFVVSLFLPYTVDFQEPKEEEPARPDLQELGREPSTTSLKNVSVESLIKKKPSHITLPETPAAMQAMEDYFTPAHSSTASHFFRHSDGRSNLVRSDAHVPEWGAGGFMFNQPRSRADAAPPDTIIEYHKAQERAQALRKKKSREHTAALYKSKSGGDDRWAQPYTIVPAIQGNGGLSNAISASKTEGNLDEVIAVGLIGFPTDAVSQEKKTEIYERLEEEHLALSVYVSDKDYDGHYAHYCKTILWPVFHYVIPDHPKSKAFLDHSWVFYENVNRAFADKVVKNYKRGDVIWVHDYHLCLVPAMIRQKLPDAKIGFFLHTAFPSSEVFRCLAARKQLLEGMLGANLVAFQTEEYSHHFLQTCSRILAVEATEDGIQLENRFVNVYNSPIGVNPMELSQARGEKEVQDSINTMLERYKGKFVFVARDKLDSIRGVRQKLLSFELFLNRYPEWKDKVVLIQVATSTQEDAELASTVADIVTRIDATHSTLTHNPLVFLRQDISFNQYLALLSIADALVVTSLREGMNLTCHEFICCQDGMYGKKHGPVILSEFTGSSDIFQKSELNVNPWNYAEIANAFKISLEMGDEEKERRYTHMRNQVLHHTGEFWMRNLSEHLSKVFEEQFRRDTMSIPRLSIPALIKDYEASWKRLFLLDYEGTLASYGAVKKTVITNTDKVTNVLAELATDDKNAVYVMSGRPKAELELLFNRIPGVGLIAENGCFLREPGTGAEWVQFPDKEKTAKWMESITQILQYYLERVEGSWIEERQCSLVFHYESANDKDAATASRQAGECANHINDAAMQQRVRAIPTKDSVIIEPADYDKATAAQHILDKYAQADRPEFLLVAGNDRDDETIFKWAKNMKENWIIRNVQSVTVGDRNSLALSTLPNGTTGLLSALAKLSKVKTNH